MSTSINVHSNLNIVDVATGGKLTYEGGVEIGSASTTTSSFGTAIAIGKGANVSADQAIAIGSLALASANGAIALGNNISAEHTDSIYVRHRALSGNTVTLAGFREGSNELIEGADNTSVSGNVEFINDVTFSGNVSGLPTAVGSFSAGTTGFNPSTPSTGDIVLSGVLNTTNGGTGLSAIGSADQILGVNSAGTSLEYKSDLNLSGNLVLGGIIKTDFLTIDGNCILSNDMSSSICLNGGVGGGVVISGNIQTDFLSIEGNCIVSNDMMSSICLNSGITISGPEIIIGNINFTGGGLDLSCDNISNVTILEVATIQASTECGDGNVTLTSNINMNSNNIFGVNDLIVTGNVDVSSVLNVATICGPSSTPSLEWDQLGMDIDGEAVNDRSGWNVSLSSDGNTVAIAAPYNDGNGSDSGHVRIYDWNGLIWVQRGADINGEAAGNRSGWSVSLSSDGNIVAIGVRYNSGNGYNSGHCRIYAWNGSSWVQRGADIDGEAANDQSGLQVSLSSDGNTVAIGAPGNDGNGYNSGHVRIYDWNGSSWVQRGADIDGESPQDQSGAVGVSLSSDGNTVAIGAWLNDGNGNNAGHTRIYAWNGSSWVQRGADIDGEAADDRSGYSVSLSSDGNTVAIGAFYNDGNGSKSGHTRIYAWNGSSWVQRGADIDGEAAGDRSGYSVSLSSEGNTVAIGADLNDGNGYNSGHVRIYDWNGSSWVERGGDIDGEAANNYSGLSVSLSSDGNTVAIGAFGNNGGNGTFSGHARVYRWPSASASRPIDMCCSDLTNVTSIAVSTINPSLTCGDGNVTLGSDLNMNSFDIFGVQRVEFLTDTIIIGNVDTSATSSGAIAIGGNAIASSSGAVALGENVLANQINGFFVKHRGPIAATVNMAGFIAGTNELVEITSSRRFKENIRDLEDVSVKFDQLRPVRYNPILGHGDTREHIGLIAEEVQEVFPEFVTYDANSGETTGLMFDRMIAVLIQEIQTLKRRHAERDVRDAERDGIIQELRDKLGM